MARKKENCFQIKFLIFLVCYHSRVCICTLLKSPHNSVYVYTYIYKYMYHRITETSLLIHCRCTILEKVLNTFFYVKVAGLGPRVHRREIATKEKFLWLGEEKLALRYLVWTIGGLWWQSSPHGRGGGGEFFPTVIIALHADPDQPRKFCPWFVLRILSYVLNTGSWWPRTRWNPVMLTASFWATGSCS
jgi:hypothetical protein